MKWPKFNKLRFKRYIQKFTNIHCDLTCLMNHEIVKKYKNLNILRTEHNISTK